MSKIVTADSQAEPVKFASQGLMATFGAGTPREMMVWSVILAIIAYVTTVLSLGATAVLVVLFTMTFLVGLVRLIWAAWRG